MSLQEIEIKISELATMTHGNFAAKTSDYFKFLCDSFLLGQEISNQLAQLINKINDNKIAFLSIVTICIIENDFSKIKTSIELYKQKFGEKYLVTLEINLRVFLNAINKNNKNEFLDIFLKINSQLCVNTINSMSYIQALNKDSNILLNVVNKVFNINRCSPLKKSMTIGIVFDDISPLITSTSSKLIYDLVAVMLEYTAHKIVIINSRLHTPDDNFWLPGIHQNRILPLEEYAEHYDINLNDYKDRLKTVEFNKMFYELNTDELILNLDVIITYPFRHNILEPVLYKVAPVVEVELMSGMSDVLNCDIIVPNGTPTEIFLRTHYSKVVATISPVRKYKGVENKDIKYLEGIPKFIVSAAVDFDKRTFLDIEIFIDCTANLLNEYKSLSWVFIGGTKGFEDMVISRHKDLMELNRIICVKYEHNLPRLFERAYLYVHPPILGGGRSPIIAIENRCPALSFQSGDCTKYIPYSCQFKSYEDIFCEISTLIKNKEKREELLSLCLSMMNDSAAFIEAALSYDCAIRRARAKFNARCSLT